MHPGVNEVVLHFAIEGDEHLYTPNVQTIIDTLKSIYAGQLKKNLCIFEIDARSLYTYVTS